MSALLFATAIAGQTIPLPPLPPVPPPPPANFKVIDVLKGDSVGAIFSDDDYPPEALDRGDQGTVGVLLHVDAAGSVQGCEVELSSSSDTLDAATCRIIVARARFLPARDAQGRATESTYHQKVIWAIADTGYRSGPWVNRFTIEYDSKGRAETCRVEMGEPFSPTKVDECEPSDLLASAIGLRDLPKGIRMLVLELRFTPGRTTPLKLAENEVLMARTVRSVAIDATGEAVSCRVIEQHGSRPSSDPCAGEVGRQYDPRNDGNGKAAAFTATYETTLYARLGGATAGKK